jgi:menaquinone-specific isochorismate synthase
MCFIVGQMDQFSLEQFLISGAYMQMSPTHLLVGWGSTACFSTLCSNRKAPYFYINDFFLNADAPWIQFEHWMTLPVNAFASLIGHPPAHLLFDWTIDSQQTYQKSFYQLKEMLESGDLHKGVPYVFSRSKAQMTKERLCRIISTSLKGFKPYSNYLYGYWNAHFGVAGVTPEILFTHSTQEPQIVRTMALAGTCAAAESNHELMQNQTILHEHNLVVNGIKEACSKFGEVCPTEVKIISLPKLSHLMTPITVNLRTPFTFQDWVEALHPTPALGTFPKASGKKWLKELDRILPRRFYGSPVGFASPEERLSTCFVAIRNVQWDHNGLSIGAGGGVVKESLYEKEWFEIQLKTHAIKALLGF